MSEIIGSTTVEAQVLAQKVSVTSPVMPPSAPVQVQQIQASDPSLPAKTTFQQDLTTAGQRKINLIWEYTQAVIALLVVVTTMVSGLYGMIQPTVTIGTGLTSVQMPVQIPTIIGVAFGMVTGFYFSRTNHAAIGGVGEKPQEQYTGR
jgi:hypothetical protein